MEFKIFWHDHLKADSKRTKFLLPVSALVIMFHWLWEKWHFGISQAILELCGRYERWASKK